MNNKISPKTHFTVFKDTLKKLIGVFNLLFKKVKEDIIYEYYGFSVFMLYGIIIVCFAFWYNAIYQSNSNNFLISNSELNQNMKDENIVDKKESLALIENTLKIKKIEIDSVKLVQNALNLFDKNSTYLRIHDSLEPDSILFYQKRSFKLRLVKKNSIEYLVKPIFESQTYQYEIYANYRKLDYYFSDDNEPIDINIIVRSRETMKPIYYRQVPYYSPSAKKYIDIKTFYTKSVLILNNWVKDRLFERENEYQDLKDEKKEIISQLKDSNHYLSFWDFLYFSTITQSSTGYGNILPNSQCVRMVVTLQIILGLLTLSIVITLRPKKNSHK